MQEIGFANVAAFFVFIGICLIFIAAWILKAEARVNICKEEITRLRNQTASFDREKADLLAKISSLENAAPEPAGSGSSSRELKEALARNESLETENRKLKHELSEAKKSLEEVYKALSA